MEGIKLLIVIFGLLFIVERKPMNIIFNFIGLVVTVAILLGQSVDGSTTIKTIKNGKFKVVDEKLNVSILDYVTDLLKVIPRMARNDNRYTTREYIKFLRTAKTYNHKKFLDNLKKNKKEFILATQEEGKLVELFTKLK